MKPVKRILFLTDNYPPEVNAPATRTHEHAGHWVGKGYEVTVITCAPNFPHGKVYEGFKNKPISIEEKDQLRNFQPPVSGEVIMKYFGLKPSREIGIIKESIQLLASEKTNS